LSRYSTVNIEYNGHCESKKTSILWQILTDFRNFFTVEFSKKFTTMVVALIIGPPHLIKSLNVLLHYLVK